MRHLTRTSRGAFTLIELLTVIAIIMLIVAIALPNFVAMMKGQKWTTAVSTIQGMVMRARVIATNVRKDMSVEFKIEGDNGTWIWIEAESNLLERVPDLDWLQHDLGGGGFIAWIIFTDWWYAGGPISWDGFYYRNLTPADIDPANARAEDYGDNTRQSEVIKLGGGLTIEDSPSASPNFVNWDSPQSVRIYGSDQTRDIRIAPNGALVQTQDPTLSIRMISSSERQRVQVVRCTGRLVRVP